MVDSRDMGSWEREVRAVFARIKSHRKPYDVKVGDIAITVDPDVFSPAYFTDSEWFARKLSEIVGSGSLLEIGTGTGIIFISCAKNGATGATTDVNPAAVACARKNFLRHSIAAPVYEGDMYSPLPDGARFAYIFWNHPFNNGTNPEEEMLLRAGFDYRYEGVQKFIGGARKHLLPGGRLLLGTGNNADHAAIARIAQAHGYRIVGLVREAMPLSDGKDGVPNEYIILELVRA